MERKHADPDCSEEVSRQLLLQEMTKQKMWSIQIFARLYKQNKAVSINLFDAHLI